MIISTTVRKIYACADKKYLGHREAPKKLEPVSSTSRRGARAVYHDEYPRDFGPRIAYTVSLVSDTCRPPTLCRPPIRQGGREMSAPRPYETYPFHPPALFTSYTTINLYIYTKLYQLFLPCGIYIVSWKTVHLSFTHVLFQEHLFQGSVPFWGHFFMYMARIGTRYCEMTAIQPLSQGFSPPRRGWASKPWERGWLPLKLDTGAVHSNMALAQSTHKFCEFTKGNVVKPKNLVLSNELVRVELSPRKIWKLTFRCFERYLRFGKSTFQ